MHTNGSDTITGTVKWFNPAKGYGFITPDDAGKDCFVHHSGLDVAPVNGKRNLDEGQRVEFEIVQGTKGPQAERVRVLR